MPTRQRPHGRHASAKQDGIFRAAADELGITTPKETERPRRKGPMRRKLVKGRPVYFRN